MSTALEDYALIGNCRSAALVSRAGSIDWLCLPRFDSGACFAALLGDPSHGRWSIAPVGKHTVERRYTPDTMVLETEFRTPTGTCRVTDCMVVEQAHPTLIRIVDGLAGSVDLALELILRFDYGSIVPWVQKQQDGSLRAIGGPDTVFVHAPIPLHGEDMKTVAAFTVKAGEQLGFSLIWRASHGDAITTPSAPPAELLAHTVAWWQAWSQRSTYKGVAAPLVMRSLLTLKALTYTPSGGMVAAPTTSLPEQLGGVRNWDYRHCWLRDATFTLYALLTCGYRDEACHWRAWLARAVAGAPSQLKIMYGISGERRIPEFELDWLPGYADSKPVRVGNAASTQLQLDVFGEIMDTLSLADREGLEYSEDSWRVEKGMLEYLETIWHEPDMGIWEVRGPARHFTHSKVMAWVAFDRGVKAIENSHREGPLERWRTLRDKIHAEVCARGYDPTLGSFVQSYGSDAVDASLLMMCLVGFLPATDPRIAGTVARIEQTLLHGGLVLRYRDEQVDDGLPDGEGAFLACSFWLVDNYILLGRRADAERLFDHLLGLCNDVGLLAEEYDPIAKRQLGNFPQAFSHIALINSAANLSRPDCPADDRSGLCWRAARASSD